MEPTESPASDAAAGRRALATRAALMVDAADYFAAARLGMLKARRRIMLIGWDFDARIRAQRFARRLPGEPRTLGEFILWLVDSAIPSSRSSCCAGTSAPCARCSAAPPCSP